MNMLKPYYSREDGSSQIITPVEIEEVTLMDMLEETRGGHTLQQIEWNQQIEPNIKKEILKVLAEFSNLFSYKPGKTYLAEHHIDTGDHPPILMPLYKANGEMLQNIQREMKEILARGIIQPSTSP